MRLTAFNINAKYVQGKDMYVSDALSRDPLKSADSVTEEEVEMHVQQVEYSWPMTDAGLERIARATQEDVTLRAAFEYTVNQSHYARYSKSNSLMSPANADNG